MEILSFFAGILCFGIPTFFPLLFIVAALVLKAPARILIWFLAAVAWAWLHQWWWAETGMPDNALISKATVIGLITSVPADSESKIQFEFLITRLNNRTVKTHALLACYDHCPVFKAGQQWQFSVKLKRPENSGNPGHFNFKGALNARHIAWSGYLKPSSALLMQSKQHSAGILSMRESAAQALRRSYPDPATLGIVQALTLGITTRIDKNQWTLFRRTGTTHLMVISGAHIGLVAGLMYWLLRRLWSRSSRLCRFRPAASAASLGGIFAALIYAVMAGFAVPAQRALIACTLLFLRNFLAQRFTAWQGWRYGLLLVLIMEPHAVLLPGFYLSFLAVAILLTASQGLPGRGIKKTMGLQLACLIGLMPFTLYWFSYGALNGFLANLIAIPLVGYGIVPLALLSLLVMQFFESPTLLYLLSLLIKLLLIFLEKIDALALINFEVGLPGIASMLALILALIIKFLLPGKVHWPAVVLLLLSAVFPGFPQVKNNEAQIDILDVGQGLAIVVRTASHTLIYDTGGKLYRGSDMAQLAVIPYLATLGIKQIDTIIISHPDLDHRGGLPSLEAKFSVGTLLVDNPDFYKRGHNCHRYPAWQWDGIFFQFFPVKQAFRDKNNSSCVLRISNKQGSILLTGDIEKSAEDYLLATYPEQLAANYLVVAHHGSKTSSSDAFIQQVSPEYAVISAGFDNRYHFPHPHTLQTLARQGTRVFNTINCGMVTLKLQQTKLLSEPGCYRIIKR